MSTEVVPIPSPEEHEARKPPCLPEHPECSTCGGIGEVGLGTGRCTCSECRGYGWRLCAACEWHTDELIRIQDSFPTKEARADWNIRWLGLGLPASAQRVLRSVPRIQRGSGPHGA